MRFCSRSFSERVIAIREQRSCFWRAWEGRRANAVQSPRADSRICATNTGDKLGYEDFLRIVAQAAVHILKAPP